MPVGSRAQRCRNVPRAVNDDDEMSRRDGLPGTAVAGAFAGNSAFGRTAQMSEFCIGISECGRGMHSLIRGHGPGWGIPTLLTPYQRHTTRRLRQCHCY